MIADLMKKLGLDVSPENFHIRAEQMRTLLRAYPSMIAANLAMVSLVSWFMWGKIDHALLLSWAALLYAFHASEVYRWLKYPVKIGSIEECRYWQRMFWLSDSFLGILWGSAGIFMFVPGDPLIQAFLLCILLGVSAAAVASNLAFPLSQQSYLVLILSPILCNMLAQGIYEYYLLAAMVGVFAIFLMKTGLDQCKLFEQSIQRGFEHSRLVNDLQHANAQLALAQREARAGLWDWNIATGKMDWSDELFTLFGLDPRKTKASLGIWRRLVHPADRQLMDQKIDETSRLGTPLYGEYRIILPGGREKWIATSGNLTRNEQGEAGRMIGLSFDITAQKEDRQRAQRAESRYQVLVEHAAYALFVHDFEGRILDVNRQACEMLGYAREELLHLAVRDIDPGFDPEESRRTWSQLESGAHLVFESSHRRKDGEVFPVEVRLTITDIDGDKLVMALIDDISERVYFETELKQSEERYRTFAEKLPLGITVLQDGLIKYVNEAMTQLIGYSEEELLGRPFHQLIHEEDRAWAVELHRQRMLGYDVREVFTVKMQRKDGTVRKWELHTSTTEWDGRRSSLAIVSDITERVAMEAALRDSLRQLEEKELAKTRFLAAAGHDLRQPVAAANLFVDALKNTMPNQQQNELIARLDQSMQVFSGLLERLLDISKFDAGLIKPQVVSFNLAEMFTWLEENFAENARNRGLAFRIFFPFGKLLVVRTDIGLLQSVMMNLVTNAIKFTAQGGILISARLRGGSVLVQVWDTGCGIAGKDMRHIFDEFYQAGNPQRNREAGLGLGLSICQRAMTLLGGQIGCRSRPGRGSVFEFSLELNFETQNVRNLPDRSTEMFDATPMQGKQVVVVEDDQLVSAALISLLQGIGASVLHFQNAEEALCNPDVALADYFVVDYSLGGRLSGVDFLHIIQSHSSGNIRAVVMTGETSSHFIDAVDGLVWPVLHKPVNYAKLASALMA